MSKNYAVARVQQYTKASIGKSERHIERKNQNYENMNVDLSQTPRNVHFQSCGDLTYNATLDMYLENVEYPVIYKVDLAVISRSGNRRE